MLALTFSPPPARFRRLLRLLVALVLAGLITHGTYAGTGDEPHYLAIAHSLAFDGDLDVANNYGASEPLIAGGSLDAGRDDAWSDDPPELARRIR